MTKSPTKYQKILINSNRNSDLQVAVVVAVAGAHTREIWSRLPLEIAVAIEDRCCGEGPLVDTLLVIPSYMISHGAMHVRFFSLIMYL